MIAAFAESSNFHLAPHLLRICPRISRRLSRRLSRRITRRFSRPARQNWRAWCKV